MSYTMPETSFLSWKLVKCPWPNSNSSTPSPAIAAPSCNGSGRAEEPNVVKNASNAFLALRLTFANEARVVDRGSDAHDDEVKAVSWQSRGRHDPTVGVLHCVPLGQPRLVERGPALRQRRQTIRVSFEEYDVAALFRQADGCREPHGPGADDRCTQPLRLHEWMVADGDRLDARTLSTMDERSPRALPASGQALKLWAPVVG